MNTYTQYAAASGHPLATKAAIAILEEGGNAIDAGVAAGMALGVLHCELVNFAGVAPIMIRSAQKSETVTIDGLGGWPAAATTAFFEESFDGAIPEGILRTVVPAAPAAWIRALRDYGTISFGEAARFAIEYARDGFEVYELFAEVIAASEADFRRTPESAKIYLPNGRPPHVGERFIQTDLAASIQYVADEESAAGGDRLAGLQAAHDAFYKGDIARKICDHHRANNGFLALEDLANYQVRYEQPLRVSFGDFEIVTCGAWCQGISLAQAFSMLDASSLAAMGQNSSAYIHHLTEVFKLVFADREHYVADPLFVDVPVADMLAADYLAARRSLIRPDLAWPDLPPPGDPCARQATLSDTTSTQASRVENPSSALDTSYLCVIDGEGNVFSATPSDTASTGEVIPGTGLCPSSRGSQSRGVSTSINALMPGKRPRLTPNPAIALRNGEPFMAFGTPGGDVQIQAMIQVFANHACFGMPLDEAIAAPRFATYSFPSSFAPNEHFPGLLKFEPGIDQDVASELTRRGHDVQWWPRRDWHAGGVCAVQVESTEPRRLKAAADPRRAGTADGL
ncbi:MAG: gamma-glutamyltransferase family protein [Burkholderiaceae bacterium]